jgi:hypothetical protein
MFLGEHLFATASYFSPAFSIMGSLPGISSLPDQRLMHHSRIKRDSKHHIADLDILYDFSANIIHWDLHFLAPFA